MNHHTKDLRKFEDIGDLKGKIKKNRRNTIWNKEE